MYEVKRSRLTKQYDLTYNCMKTTHGNLKMKTKPIVNNHKISKFSDKTWLALGEELPLQDYPAKFAWKTVIPCLIH